MTTVIYHSADYDGIFCREIAKHFLGDKDVNYVGWNFGDPPLEFPQHGAVYVMDLPLDKPFGLATENLVAFVGVPQVTGLVWLDHHKSAIESHPANIPGYRIDGVAACRLAWQWFNHFTSNEGYHSPDYLPTKQDFIDRKVSEPLAVRLAGEYDVWDKRDQRVDVFQYGLRCLEADGYDVWDAMFRNDDLESILEQGRVAQKYSQKQDADLVTHKSFRLKWEGLTFLCLNTGRFNSLTFAALDKPVTGHDALLGFMWNGKVWTVSLYHAKHRTDLDLSQIAVKHGGGGHRGACGFTCKTLPFALS